MLFESHHSNNSSPPVQEAKHRQDVVGVGLRTLVAIAVSLEKMKEPLQLVALLSYV